MATHHLPPEAPEDDEAQDTGAPNSSHLPVEPEFGPLPPAAEPEEPVGRPPPI